MAFGCQFDKSKLTTKIGEMTTIGERIRLLRGEKTRDDYAPKLGVSKNTLASYETGNSVPNHTVMSEILVLHPEISPSWLLTGEGPMRRGEVEQVQRPQNDESSFDLIPMVEAELSAGGGSFVQSENVTGLYAFRKDWIRKIANGPKDMVLMRVMGDSMHPTIQARDTVMIDTGRKIIMEGEIYALRYDNTIMIKRLSFRPGGRLQIISDNREYQPYEADTQDIHIIGQIIFFSRVLIPE